MFLLNFKNYRIKENIRANRLESKGMKSSS
jgi:hypothetical protein